MCQVRYHLSATEQNIKNHYASGARVLSVRSADGMLSREQKRPGPVDVPVDAADVDVRPDVFLPGQNGDAAGPDRVLQGQLLQRVRHAPVAHGHRPDSRVLGPGPVTAVRRRAQHDRQPVAQVPVPAAAPVRQRQRRRHVHRGHSVEAGHHPDDHTPETPRPLLPVFHRLHGAPGAHQPHQRPVLRHPAVVRGH